ncbi:MAG: hypothetical protein U9N86_17640 [Bacteroidota bacterium]|nr:hypothetical protein [Bacteroidota bacterium]
MTKKTLLLQAILLLSLSLSPSLFSQRTIWTIGTARTVPKGQAEFGILHPLQVGLTETLEFSTQAILSLALAPNFSLKKRWYVDDLWMISSQHRYSMPTLLLRAMGETDWFKNIPDTITYPFLFSIGNEGLFTRKIGPEMLITAKIGAEFAIKTSGDSIPFLEQPVAYPHTAAFSNKLIWYVGFDLDGNIVRNHNFSADLDFYSIGAGIDYWALEHKGYYIYNHSIKLAILVGYKLSYATYPGGNQFFIAPMADLIWKINARKVPEKDLFRR